MILKNSATFVSFLPVITTPPLSSQNIAVFQVVNFCFLYWQQSRFFEAGVLLFVLHLEMSGTLTMSLFYIFYFIKCFFVCLFDFSLHQCSDTQTYYLKIKG